MKTYNLTLDNGDVIQTHLADNCRYDVATGLTEIVNGELVGRFVNIVDEIPRIEQMFPKSPGLGWAAPVPTKVVSYTEVI